MLQRQKEKETDETRSVKNKRMQRQTISEGDERIIRKRRHRDEQRGERKDGERGCRKNVILSKVTQHASGPNTVRHLALTRALSAFQRPIGHEESETSGIRN